MCGWYQRQDCHHVSTNQPVIWDIATVKELSLNSPHLTLLVVHFCFISMATTRRALVCLSIHMRSTVRACGSKRERRQRIAPHLTRPIQMHVYICPYLQQ